MNTLRQPLLSSIRPSTTLSAAIIRPSHTPTITLTPITTRGLKQKTAFRRHRKELNIPPAPEFTFGQSLPPTGSSGRSRLRPGSAQLPVGDHIVFNPPSSAPNVYHTPSKFLPKSDIRSQLLLSSQEQFTSTLPTTTLRQQMSALPRALSMPYEKQYNMSEAQIEELRALRQSNEDYWTRSRLAEKFKCSSLFVGMVVQASEKKLAAHQRDLKMQRGRMGMKRRTAREERVKRKEKWGRDE